MNILSGIKLSLVGAILIVGLNGCNTAIKLAEFKPATLPKGVYTPSQNDLKAHKNKIVLMQFKNGNRLSKKINVGDIISRFINNKLPNAGSVDIVRYTKETTLIKGINPTQLSKHIDIKSAQYLIAGEINKATYNYHYEKSYETLLVDKNGNRIWHEPTHNYKACIKGNITIFELPSLNELKTLPLKNCQSYNTNADKYKKYVGINYDLVKKSAKEAIKKTLYDLKNFFAIKGYITEKKVNGDKIIVKTSLTKAFGAKEGEDVDIYSGDTLIGKGKISNQITQDGCWVIIDEINNGATIKFGDYVKIKYEKGFFG